MIWVFLVGLALVLVAMAIVAVKTPRATIPVDTDGTWRSIAAFYRGRPDRAAEVELGNRWTSERDPGAAFAISWIGETGELVALRRAEHPLFLGGGGIFAAVPTPLGNKAKTGMKVLGIVDLAHLRSLRPHELELQPDGLDQLTAALGCPYVAPRPGRAEPGGATTATGATLATGATTSSDGTAVEPPTPVVLVVFRDPDVRYLAGTPRMYASGRTIAEVLAVVDRRIGASSDVVAGGGSLVTGRSIYLGHPDRPREASRYASDLDVGVRDGDTITIES
jgi:hypothetical protein